VRWGRRRGVAEVLRARSRERGGVDGFEGGEDARDIVVAAAEGTKDEEVSGAESGRTTHSRPRYGRGCRRVGGCNSFSPRRRRR
jgi:hypothetical protein